MDKAPDFHSGNPPFPRNDAPVVRMSAKTGQNLDALLSAIETVLAPHVRQEDAAPVLPNPRQAYGFWGGPWNPWKMRRPSFDPMMKFIWLPWISPQV